MKTKLTTLLILVTLAVQAFEYQAEIEKIKTTGSDVELVKIPVQQTVFPNLRSDFKDLVVLTKDQKSLPFTLRQESTVTKKSYFTYQPINVDRVKVEKDHISVDINLVNPQILSSLKIRTPLNDFEFVVTLKNKKGEVIAEQSIYDYSSFTSSRQEIITFSPQTLQQFTVTIKGLNQLQTKELFELREVSGSGTSKVEKTSKININKPRFRFLLGTKKQRLQSKPLFEAVQQGLIDWHSEEKDHQTIITINTHKLPISAINLNITEKNFKRNFTVRSADKRNRLFKSGQIECWNYRKFHLNHTKISLPNFTDPEIILIIDHDKKSPLTISDITFTIPKMALFFLMNPTTAYSIHFGDSNYKNTATPIPASIMKNTDKALVGRMGIVIKNKVTTVTTISSSNYGFLITPIVLAIMALLAWVIFDTLKKTDKK
ncbi:MAG: hypothetical protein KAG98_01670 [Lentisphaeria bacterium]|nr:hypothetical protein [Lentisphaeria bacterium]